jgi:hypothetical protein
MIISQYLNLHCLVESFEFNIHKYFQIIKEFILISIYLDLIEDTFAFVHFLCMSDVFLRKWDFALKTIFCKHDCRCLFFNSGYNGLLLIVFLLKVLIRVIIAGCS